MIRTFGISKEHLTEQFVLFLRYFRLVNCHFGGVCCSLLTLEQKSEAR